MEFEPRPGLQALSGAMGVLTGFGILLFALFPLALPIVVLTSLLLVPLLPFAIVGGLLAALALGARAVLRRVSRAHAPREHPTGERGGERAERHAPVRHPGPAQ